jgi:drug/metabolite transporter (DMT)-like permease
MAVRSLFAVVFFWTLLALPRIRRELTDFRRTDMGVAVTSAFFGTALGMSLLTAALSTGDVGIDSTLSSMTPLVILPMVWLRTGQMPRIHAWCGAGLAIVGTALISLGYCACWSSAQNVGGVQALMTSRDTGATQRKRYGRRRSK